MTAIHLKGPIPGPNSRALLDRRNRAVAQGLSVVHPIFADHASGHTLTDVDGNTFLDFTGGIGCLNIGHSSPEVAKAVARQAERFTHTCFQIVPFEEYVAVAEALCRLAPGTFEKRVLLTNSGAEAVENAVKIARRATGRMGVLCFEHAFHGRTMLGLALTGKADPYKIGFGPYPSEIYRLPFPDAYRDASLVGRLEEALLPLVHPKDLAAVIIEPVLGEGGFAVPPAPFFQELRALCDKHGIVLIADEVQCGMGRTGTFFASERFKLVPDLLVVAKSIAGGLPLGGVVGRSSLMEKIQVGGLGGTFSGNPVTCAAAVASIALIEKVVSSGRAEALGDKLFERLKGLQERYVLIGDVKGAGAMRSIELVTDRDTKEPAPLQAKALLTAARERGLLLLTAGTHGNIVRFLMPLTIDTASLDEGFAVFEEALDAVSAGRR